MRENCEKCGERLTGYFVHIRRSPMDEDSEQTGNYYYHCPKCGNQGVEKFSVRAKSREEIALEKERITQLLAEEQKNQRNQH